MARLRQHIFFFGSVMSLAGCLEPYQPPVVTQNTEIIVVDGFINATDHSASVTLSYASPLTSTTPSEFVPGASVSIEGSDGGSYSLNETGQGIYTLANMPVDFQKKYKLHVTTADDKKYVSDFIEISQSPQIDSVTWRMDDNGVRILLNTHDPAGISNNYRWSFVETWEYTASFVSTYKMVDGTAIERPHNEEIWMCWYSEPSSEIIIGSSNRLSEAVIRDFPITFLPGNSVKISRRYSILVQQRALTSEEYDFWLQLKKTTESLGGLFDPLPSQVLGNLKSVSASGEPVLGYFSGGEVSEKRIFIGYQELPDELLALKEPALCQSDRVTSIPVENLPRTPNSTYLIDPLYVQGVGIVGYTTADAICVDCQLQGGSTIEPDFW